MKKLFFIAIAGLTLAACHNKGECSRQHITAAVMDSLRSDLLKADIAFSELSGKEGRNAAFVEYAAKNAVMLRPFSRPVAGRDSLKNMLNAHPDSLYKLTWTPIAADVAKSGEIGFTYGIYKLEVKGLGNEEGTYCTVWHKDTTNTWKYILDTGNEGLNAAEKKEDEKIDAKEKQ